MASWKRWLSSRQLEIEAELGLLEDLAHAKKMLATGDAESARRTATRVASRARSLSTENTAWELVAWAELALERPTYAAHALSEIRPRGTADSHCLAAVEVALERPSRAVTVLEGALTLGALTHASLRMLIDLYAQNSAFGRACAAADAGLDVLGIDDARCVVGTTLAAKADATTLARRIFLRTHSPDDAIAYACCLACSGDRSRACQVLLNLAQELSASELQPTTVQRLHELAAQPVLGAMIGPALLRPAHASAK